MKSSLWQIGTWKNIPLFLHWTVFLWLLWYWGRHESVVWGGLCFLAFVALLAAHELGHAMAARSRRVKVFSIKLYFLHGLCEHEVPHYEHDDVFIAWGGVFAQACVLAMALTAKNSARAFHPQTAHLLEPVFAILISGNILMALVNLIPVAPLDGHKAWRVVPLLVIELRPTYRRMTRWLKRALNFKKRREVARESQRVTTELLDRLKKK